MPGDVSVKIPGGETLFERQKWGVFGRRDVVGHRGPSTQPDHADPKPWVKPPTHSTHGATIVALVASLGLDHQAQQPQYRRPGPRGFSHFFSHGRCA